jgi:RNA polymerase sigma-70 factor (ECF subfamily)
VSLEKRMEAGAASERIAAELEQLRGELTAYLTRIVLRPDVAEELVQTAAVRALEAAAEGRAPADDRELRPWLFRIATNLAIDERRRHGSWREDQFIDARGEAESRPEFVAFSETLRGSPEMAAIAREHLAVCFSCTLGHLEPEQAAALLLKEVYGFTTEESAGILGARFAQAKNWLQAARAAMESRYAATCALIRKDGVCYQCVELDGYFGANRGNPLAGAGGRDLASRLEIVKALALRAPGPWHRRLLKIFDEI